VGGSVDIVDEVLRHWYVNLTIPLVAAVIGYVTKLVAIRMMFEPMEYRGRRPFGWQGIIPRRAARMAGIATDTMTENLISASDVVQRLDPARVAAEIKVPLAAALEDIVREVALEFQPGLWESMPEAVRRRIIRRAQDEAPRIVENVLRTVQSDIDAVFDLKDMIVTNLVSDKELLNRMFKEAGSKEFRFIARSGIWFGFGIGLVQMLLWAQFHEPLIMPLFGLAIGWFSDWIALKMVFRPQQPKRYLGLIEWQGLFLKRRYEVGAKYASLIATEIVTPRNILEAVLRGPLSDKIVAMVSKQIQQAFDRQTGLARPLVVVAVGSTRYQEMKRSVATKVLERVPETMAYVEGYVTDALDLRNMLVEKVNELSDEEFEGLLRPAFQQDEWILITIGAALGFTVGEAQALLLEHFAK
jgi:uncharacterized membrane protein YheB (UPF0754 family)